MGGESFLAGPALTSFATANFAAMVPPASSFQHIPATTFTMGDAADEHALPEHPVTLSGFSVSGPITNRNFARFAAVVRSMPFASFIDLHPPFGRTRIMAIGDSYQSVRSALSRTTLGEIMGWFGFPTSQASAFQMSFANYYYLDNIAYIPDIGDDLRGDCQDEPALLTWRGAALFADLAGAGHQMRLPTEAELELVARLRTPEQDAQAGFQDMTPDQLTNSFWTGDWYEPYYYVPHSGEAQKDPIGPTVGQLKVARAVNGNPTLRQKFHLDKKAARLCVVIPDRQ